MPANHTYITFNQIAHTALSQLAVAQFILKRIANCFEEVHTSGLQSVLAKLIDKTVNWLQKHFIHYIINLFIQILFLVSCDVFSVNAFCARS